MNIWDGLTKPLRTPMPPEAPRPHGWNKSGLRNPPKNNPGDTVGEWTLLEFVPGRGNGREGRNKRVHSRWLCQCSCGEQRLVRTDNLTNGLSHSCGHDSRIGRRWKPGYRAVTQVT